QGKPVRKPAANLIDGKNLQLRSGELERQRYAVEAPADLGYSPDVCVIEAKLRHHIGRALDDDAKSFAAGHENVQARCRTEQRLRKRDACIEQVLAVVQHEQRTAIGK